MQKAISLFFALLFISSGSTFAQKQGKTIKIEGKSQHYLTIGIEDRKLGQPLVIFESSLGINLETWQRVINELGETTPVLAYDRAGIGQSEAMDETPNPKNRTKQLKALLDKLELAPPYILVGHKWGGILIKDFALTYPQDIEAMIYVDPINRSSSRSTMIALLDREGLEGEKIATEHFKLEHERLVNVPEGVRAEGKAILDLTTGDSSETKLFDYPKIPSVIFVGGMHEGYMEDPFNALPVKYQEFINILQKNRITEFTQQTLQNTDSEMVLLSDYTYYLNLQASEKIGSAILSRYFGDPAKKIVLATERYSTEEFQEYLDGLLTYFPESKIPESMINGLGYDQLRRDQPEHAMILFQHNLARFPNSANVYDSVGDCLVSMEKVAEAVPYFEKAVKMGKVSRHRDLELFKKNLANAKVDK